jgi:hypothetical protein
MAFDFFLSHNRAEKDWTRELAGALRRKGASVFFDEDSIKTGENAVAVISSALETSRHVVIVLSSRSVRSTWVELEWASTLYSDSAAREKRLLPVLLEDCDVPFVLRPLKQLRASGKNVDLCADELMSFQTPHIEPSPPAIRVAVHHCLSIWDYYLERKVDEIVSQTVAGGLSAYSYGPRRIGKTSLLQRQANAARLRGASTIWVDFSAVSSDIDPAIHFSLEVIRQVRPQAYRDGIGDTNRLLSLAEECLREAETGSSAGEVVLLVDELDGAFFRSKGSLFAQMIRTMLSLGFHRNLRCIFAAYRPPWTWNEDESLSPWWSLFRVVPMSYFDKRQVTDFLLRLPVTSEEAEAVFEYTGGSPIQIMQVARAIQEGASVRELLQDPLRSSGPLAASYDWLFHQYRNLPKSDALLMRALCSGDKVNDRADRLNLWLRGFTRDPDSNPPVLLGGQIGALLQSLGYNRKRFRFW